MKDKELNGAKSYTPDTKFEFTQKRSGKLWNLIMLDKVCGENPTLQEISIYDRAYLLRQRNFGPKTMAELDAILQIAGLEIANEENETINYLD